MNFFDATHCESRAHCARCRDTTGGRAWRMALQEHFEDITERDFECPHGVAWDERPERPKQTVRLKADGNVEINGRPCVGCRKKREQRQ